MKREMTDTQYGFLYKMATSWRTRSVRLENNVWQAFDRPKQVPMMEISRSRITTLDVVNKKGWVRFYKMDYPLTGWGLTAAGFAALQNEQIRRGAVLKGMEI